MSDDDVSDEDLRAVFRKAVECRRRHYSIRCRLYAEDREFFDDFNQAVDDALHREANPQPQLAPRR